MVESLSEMRTRRYLHGHTQTPGDFSSDSVRGRILEGAGRSPLPAPIGRYPVDVGVDDDFRTGPTFLLEVAGGYVDPETGFAFDSRRRFIRESAMVDKYVDMAEQMYGRYRFDDAYPVRSGPLHVVSNQRIGNYCRWWLDSVSKLYLFSTFGTVSSAPGAVTIMPALTTRFQTSTLELLGQFPAPSLERRRLVRGDLLLSTGLTYGGGQNISPLVADFAAWVLNRSGLSRLHRPGPGRRLYVTRSRASMRRILNEADLVDDLKQRRFEIVALEDLALHEQIMRFARADVIVSAHGAGLTNVMFCRPGALLVEIFPDTGVHSSAFRRIASHVSMDYALYAGCAAPAGSETNLRNVDLTVDPVGLMAFIDSLIADRGR